MKKIILTLALNLLFAPCFAQSFDFTQAGDNSANEILKNYVKSEFPDSQNAKDFDTVAYFLNDSQDEVAGIVKSNLFYSLSGYKLFVLKNTEGSWQNVKSDIFFDNYKNIDIEPETITYQKPAFYKDKKYVATLKEGEFKTKSNFLDLRADKHVKSIEQIVALDKKTNTQTMDLSEFKTNPQKSFEISYDTEEDRSRYYFFVK